MPLSYARVKMPMVQVRLCFIAGLAEQWPDRSKAYARLLYVHDQVLTSTSSPTELQQYRQSYHVEHIIAHLHYSGG